MRFSTPIDSFSTRIDIFSSSRVKRMAIELYMYDLPKVSEDGKDVIETRSSESQRFSDLATAQAFAEQHKNEFDRIVIVESANGRQELKDRYADNLRAFSSTPEAEGAAV
jgi:hypothetical protein